MSFSKTVALTLAGLMLSAVSAQAAVHHRHHHHHSYHHHHHMSRAGHGMRHHGGYARGGMGGGADYSADQLNAQSLSRAQGGAQ